MVSLEAVIPRSVAQPFDAGGTKISRGYEEMTGIDLCAGLCAVAFKAIIVENYFGSGPSTNDDSAQYTRGAFSFPLSASFPASLSRSAGIGHFSACTITCVRSQGPFV